MRVDKTQSTSKKAIGATPISLKRVRSQSSMKPTPVRNGLSSSTTPIKQVSVLTQGIVIGMRNVYRNMKIDREIISGAAV